MTARLTLICSGATAATRAAAFPLDEPLEESAIARAAALAPFLPRATRGLVSPALRAAETASALRLHASADARLADWNLGRWAGRRIVDLGAEDPDGMTAWLSDPEAAPHGGESLAQLLDRVAGWLDERLAEGGRVVAVTHASVIRAAILHILAAPAASFWRIDVEPHAVTHFSGNGARWTLRQRSAPEAATP